MLVGHEPLEIGIKLRRERLDPALPRRGRGRRGGGLGECGRREAGKQEGGQGFAHEDNLSSFLPIVSRERVWNNRADAALEAA
jgi:hypothetical protein